MLPCYQDGTDYSSPSQYLPQTHVDKAAGYLNNGRRNVAGLLAQGAVAFELGDHAGALVSYRNALKEFPGCPPEVRPRHPGADPASDSTCKAQGHACVPAIIRSLDRYWSRSAQPSDLPLGTSWTMPKVRTLTHKDCLC